MVKALPIDDRSFVPNISIGKVILACAPHENPAVVQNNNKYFQLPSFGDKTIPASEPANVTTLSKIVFRLPIISFGRLNLFSRIPARIDWLISHLINKKSKKKTKSKEVVITCL